MIMYIQFLNGTYSVVNCQQMLALTAIFLAHHMKHSCLAVAVTCLFVVVLDKANKLPVEFNIIFWQETAVAFKILFFFYLYYHKSNDDYAFNMQFTWMWMLY